MKTYAPGSAAEFGKRLSDALESKNNGNQSELARVVGCTPQAANKWVSGIQFPREKYLRRIADFLGVTPEWLRFGSPSTPVAPPAPQYLLLYVLIEEAEILSLYRGLTERGKRQFKAAIDAAEKLPDEALPKKGQRSA